MKKRLTTFLFLICALSSYAQQRINVLKNDETLGGNIYPIKNINGEDRIASLVAITSSVKLSYKVMSILIPDERMNYIDLKSAVDADGLFLDMLYFYTNVNTSKQKLVLYADGYPNEAIELNLQSKTTYNFMVIEPEGGVTYIDESSETYNGLVNQGINALKSKNYEYAEKLFQRATTKDTTDIVLSYLALSQYYQAHPLYRKSFYSKAIKNATEALELNNSNFLANLILGVALKNRYTSYSYAPFMGERRSLFFSTSNKEVFDAVISKILTPLQKALSLIDDQSYIKVDDINLYKEIDKINSYIKDAEKEHTRKIEIL